VREDLEQQEQMEAIKGWWKDNQRWLTGLLLAVAVAAAGYTGWKYYEVNRAQKAMVLLEALNRAIESQDLDKAKAAAQPLFDSYAGLAQADMAALQLARLAAGAGDLDGARTALSVAQASKDPALAWIARTRMAAVLLDSPRPRRRFRSWRAARRRPSGPWSMTGAVMSTLRWASEPRRWQPGQQRARPLQPMRPRAPSI